MDGVAQLGEVHPPEPGQFRPVHRHDPVLLRQQQLPEWL
jgi:hypothetical protein